MSHGILRRIAGTASRRRPRAMTALLSLAAVLWWSVPASAQLDPLLFIKRVPPTVIVVMDTSLEMLEDGSGNLYDPGYWTTGDSSAMGAFTNINTGTTKTYRRIFHNFAYSSSGSAKYTASTISAVAAVWDPSNSLTSNNASDLAYLNPTRWAIARQGIAQAVGENANASSRWGLIRLRQKNPQWRSTPGGTTWGSSDCDGLVADSDGTQFLNFDASPCKTNKLGYYGIYAPQVDNASYGQSSAPAGTVVVTPGSNTAASVLDIVNRHAGDSRALIPAGVGGVDSGGQYADRPLSYALDDAKAAALAAISADAAATRSCRNTVVVLVTGGKDSGSSSYVASNDPTARASGFLDVSGHRVPIHVIGVDVAAGDKTQLQTIATNSGGVYHDATSALDVANWIDYAVQSGYARETDFDSGKASEYVAVSPIIGTVDLTSANDATGTALPNTVVHEGGIAANPIVPQRSNVMITSAFEMPGFVGRMRAFRVYQPVADSTQASGYTFQNDGTMLWPDLDSRPSLAGQARTPADPDTRNIYTYIPDGSGGGSMVAFTAANAATIAPALNLPSTISASTLIGFIRSQPLGAIIGSTPAVMDPPSLDPPPDDDYGRTDASDTFAGDHADRRTLIFVGANDGMMHAFDARTGYEVWAFIPYNLLPKLQTLYDGQPVDTYEYFVDSSPKVAEVKTDPTNADPAKRWHSLLLFGQGPGGLFYQCFDVTEAGMGVDPTLDDLSAVNSLLQTFDTPGESISFMWAFPNYDDFDPTVKQSFTLTDGTPGGKLTLWGDLKSSASYAEKTVGFSWSDPAIGPLTTDRSVNGVIMGSGYFPDIEASIPNRGATAPKAGNVLYVLNANDGTLLGNSSGSACSGTGCLSVGDVASNGRKNAIQADPTAAGDYQAVIVDKAYAGDIDGKYWRFNFDSSGAITASLMADTGVPIYASSALLFVGSADVYMFFATGSDILPVTTSGGTGTFKLYGLKDNFPGSGSTTKFSISLATVSNSGGLATGERASTSPTVAGDIVFYTTTTQSASTPCSDFGANLYGVTYAGSAAYDANGNGKIDDNESNIIKTLSGRATAPFVVDQHLYFGTSSTSTGSAIQAFGDPKDFNNGVGQVGVRILSWREIR
ncbi:MAG TPA: hypothetical protein VFX12_13920 [Vicinamibacterales bacterium]|nr:hypothetical protein [Vicinamibacterales bacterium]